MSLVLLLVSFPQPTEGVAAGLFFVTMSIFSCLLLCHLFLETT